MTIEIINKNFTKEIYGFSGIAVPGQYAATGFKLMDKMWKIVKGAGLKHKGINIWVYEKGHTMFAGVELENPPIDGAGLELKSINLVKYAHYKHIGPYNKLGEVHSKALGELAQNGFETCLPYIEMYGHWTGDENTAETDILTCLK